jgi:hypothetical protein
LHSLQAALVQLDPLVSEVVQEKMAFLAKMELAALPVPEDQVVVVTAKTGFPAATG